MNTIQSRWLRLCSAAVGLLLAAGCGGGGQGAALATSISVTNILFSRTMTVTVSGSNLEGDSVEMTVDGPCENIARVGTGSSQAQQFTCRITGVGDLRPRIRRAGGLEIASTRVTVPLPQVSMTVEQGDREGIIILELDAAAAPVTSANFLNYVNSTFYRNTIFHRVEEGTLVEGGAYTTGRNLKSGTGAAIVLESANGLKNVRGTIAMARGAEADSATSRFYLNLADNPALDFGSAELPLGNAVFGRIINGLDVADEIGKVITENDTAKGLPKAPETNVVITAISQIR